MKTYKKIDNIPELEINFLNNSIALLQKCYCVKYKDDLKEDEKLLDNKINVQNYEEVANVDCFTCEGKGYVITENGQAIVDLIEFYNKNKEIK